MNHNEAHRSHRIGWLRAAVLGANDGIVSTASLIIGFAAAQAAHSDILLAGVADPSRRGVRGGGLPLGDGSRDPAPRGDESG